MGDCRLPIPERRFRKERVAPRPPYFVRQSAIGDRQSPARDAPRWTAWAFRAALAGVLVAAFFIRARDARHVFVGGRVLVPGYDEYYHLRRIQKTVEAFPRVPCFDAYVNYPEGARIYWPEGFDLALATLAKLAGARPWTAQVERVCAWAIPVLGVLTVAAAYWLGVAWRGRGVGLLAAAMVACLPAAITVSAVGGVDHDVAVILCVTVGFGCCLRALRASRRGARLAWALSGGIALGVTLYAWSGSILFLLLPPAFFVVRAVLTLAAGGAGDDGLDVACAMMATAEGVAWSACLFSGAAWWGAPSFAFLSTLHAALALLALISPVALWGLLRAMKPAAWARRRAAKVLLVGVTQAAACVLVLSAYLGVRNQLGGLAGFVAARTTDVVVATADEAQPLFRLGIEATAASLSWAVALFPVALVWTTGRVLSGKGARGDWFVALWATAMAVLAASQQRFCAHLVVPMALCLAAFAAGAWGAMSRWTPGHRRAARSLLVGGFAAALALPGTRWLPSPVAPNWELRAVLPALDWLRTESAPSGRIGDFVRPPAYGIMAFWHYGHWLTYLGQRANIACPFGNAPQHQRGLERFLAFFGARSEAEAADLCRRLGVRYVLSTDLPLALLVHLAGYDPRDLYRVEVMATSLQLWRGQRAPGENRPLRHFRLVRTFPGEAPSGRPLNTHVFEFVEHPDMP